MIDPETLPGTVWAWDRSAPLGRWPIIQRRADECVTRRDVVRFFVTRRQRLKIAPIDGSAATTARAEVVYWITLIPRLGPDNHTPIACFKNKRDQDLFFLCLYDIDKESCDAVFGEKA